MRWWLISRCSLDFIIYIYLLTCIIYTPYILSVTLQSTYMYLYNKVEGVCCAVHCMGFVDQDTWRWNRIPLDRYLYTARRVKYMNCWAYAHSSYNKLLCNLISRPSIMCLFTMKYIPYYTLMYIYTRRYICTYLFMYKMWAVWRALSAEFPSDGMSCIIISDVRGSQGDTLVAAVSLLYLVSCVRCTRMEQSWRRATA